MVTVVDVENDAVVVAGDDVDDDMTAVDVQHDVYDVLSHQFFHSYSLLHL